MKYHEETIPKTIGQLRDRIGDTMLRAPRRQFPESYDFDGTFHSMFLGVENLRKRVGDTTANQLLEMLAQAKKHYETSDNKLGGALMADSEAVLVGRQPWAYPKELYHWAVGPALPAFSEEDVQNKWEDEQ